MRKAGVPTNDHGSNNTTWTTYHYLPDPLVRDDDVILNDGEKVATKQSTNSSLFDVPVADDYFMGLLGSELLSKTGSGPGLITNTTIAIENTRLIALYFR
jgi:hypothetical protein